MTNPNLTLYIVEVLLTMFALFASVTLFFLLYCCYKVYLKKYEDVNEFPGPSMLQLIKEVYFKRSSRGIICYLETLNAKYGPIVKIWMGPFRPAIITTDMEYCNRIYKSNDHHLSPSIEEISFARITRDYNVWKSDKAIIMKAITRGYIENGLCVYDRQYDQFLDVIRRSKGKPVDVQANLRNLFLDIMLSLFEHPLATLTEDEVARYRDLRKNFFDLLLEKMNSIRTIGFLHRFTDNYRLMARCEDEMKMFADTWLEKFKRVEEHLRGEHNLVYAMMRGGMTDSRIASNITSMVQGGNGTSVLPLSSTLFEMARRPILQGKVHEEISSVLGEDLDAHVTLDDLDRMPYLHALIKESLRMYMPLPFLDRRLLYDFTINNARIPKGTRVIFNFPGILKSELNYDDPLTFNPDRFLKEKLTMREKRAYIPFGYGVKICPGRDVAFASMKLFIVKIIREFEICPVGDFKLDITAEVFYRSLNGIPVIFRSRRTK